MKKLFKLSVTILLILACILCVACGKSGSDKNAGKITVDGLSYDNGFLYDDSYFVMDEDEVSAVDMNSFSGKFKLGAKDFTVNFDWAEVDKNVYLSSKTNNKDVVLHTVDGNTKVVLCELLDDGKTVGFAQCNLKENAVKKLLKGDLDKYTITDFKYSKDLNKAVFVTEDNLVYVYDDGQVIRLSVDFGDNEIRTDAVRNTLALITYVNEGKENIYVYNFETGEFKDPIVGSYDLHGNEYVTYEQDGNLGFKNVLNGEEFVIEVASDNISEIVSIGEDRFCVFCKNGQVVFVAIESNLAQIIESYEETVYSSGIYRLVSEDGDSYFALLSDNKETTVLRVKQW